MKPLLKFFIGFFMLYGLMLILGCGTSHGVNVHYGVQWNSGYYRSNRHHHHRPPAVRPPRPPKPPGGGTRPPGGGRPTQLPAKRR